MNPHPHDEIEECPHPWLALGIVTGLALGTYVVTVALIYLLAWAVGR